MPIHSAFTPITSVRKSDSDERQQDQRPRSATAADDVAAEPGDTHAGRPNSPSGRSASTITSRPNTSRIE